jgi:hypothetical protein
VSLVSQTPTLALAPLAAVAGSVLSVVDAGLRFRRPGNGAALAVLELLLGLLLFVAVFAPVHRYVSTTIPVLFLAVPLEVVLLVLVLLRSARSTRSKGMIWFSVTALLINGVTAVLAVVRPG